MIEVGLEPEEWQRVLAVLAQGQWAIVNPLIMKIGAQLQAQAAIAETRKPDGEDRTSREPH